MTRAPRGKRARPPAPPRESPRRPAQLSPAVLRELVGWLQACGVEEFELSARGERVYLRREAIVADGVAPPLAPLRDLAPVVVTAPAVGLFHRGTEEGAPPLVEEGADVRAGQLLGVVEVLRMPHPVEAAAAGVLVRFLVESGQPVEYGQPLAELAPRPEPEPAEPGQPGR